MKNERRAAAVVADLVQRLDAPLIPEADAVPRARRRGVLKGVINGAYLDNWDEKFATVKPRKLLALDGGGICGVVSLEVLRKVEKDLAAATGKGASFRLGDFFDCIAGTSTGALTAAGLAFGKSVQELVIILNGGSCLGRATRWFRQSLTRLFE